MGWTYNTVNPDAESKGAVITAVGCTFTALSLLVVSLRMYVRVFLVRAVGADDWAIVFTWFMCLGFTIVTVLQSKWGLGLVRLSDMPPENLFTFGLLQFAGAPFYVSSILGFKLSLLFSFLRIANEKTYKMVLIGIIVCCTAFHIVFLLVQINLCTPVAKQWDPALSEVGSCIPAVPFYTSMASITIVFDVIIMFTPFPLLLRTQLPKRKKFILLGIFSLGIFITIIQIIRILTIKSLANYIDSANLIMWSMVENNLGTAVASLPPLARLVSFLRDKSSARSNRSKGWSGNEAYEIAGVGYSYGIKGGKGGKGMMVLSSGRDNSTTCIVSEETKSVGGDDASRQETSTERREAV